MCGIAGILSFSESVEITSVQKMISVLHHRGPDDEGTWINNSKKIGLGHKRLSIIDVSPLGKQPMHYLDKYSITFNGEIYNYLELKKELESHGYQFRSSSDTEVLLALYDFKKENALQDIDGMFAFAIWDNTENKLFCARDRFGEKPFFYSKDNKHFVFASEIKALLKFGISSEKNNKKIYNYLLYSALENPYDSHDKNETFYKEVYQLEPSHYMLIEPDGTISKKKYWDIDLHKKTLLKEEEYFEKFCELFFISVDRRLRSDVPVGSSLSGGLDSSSIVMIIDKLKRENHIQKTFSARFKNFLRDEGEYMSLVVQKTRVEPHFVYPSVKSVINNFEKIMYHQEEPIGSASIAAQYEVMKLAKETGITVLLDGQGADEIMAGYMSYWPTYFNQLYREDKKKLHLEEEAFNKLHSNFCHKKDIKFKWRAYHIKSFKIAGDLKRKLKSATSPYFMGIHPDIVSAYKNEPSPISKLNSLKEALYFSTMEGGLHELLRYADRNSMAHSVEVRLPFLYHDLVEFIFSVPDEMLLHNGWTKYILRNSMKDVLPTEITWRKDKIGYEPPQAEWLNSKLFKNYLNDAISFLKKEKVITKEYAELTWNYITLFSFNQTFK